MAITAQAEKTKKIQCCDCPDKEKCTLAFSVYTKDGCEVKEYV